MSYFKSSEQHVPPMPAKIAQAVVDVMGAVGKLTKDNKNSHGGYNYVGIDDFRTALNPCCAAAGLILKPVCISADRFEATSKNGSRQMIRFKYHMRLIHVSGETWTDTDETIPVEVDAVGAQATGIAQSYAWKEYAKALFQVPTGERDADAQEHLETETRRASVKAAVAERQTGETHAAWDVGEGLKPIKLAELRAACQGFMAGVDNAQALLEWFERNKAPRTQLFATDKALAMAIKKDFEGRLAALKPKTEGAAPKAKNGNGHQHHNDEDQREIEL